MEGRELQRRTNLQTGDTLDFQIEGGAIRVAPVAKGSLEYLTTILPKATRSFTVKEMNEAIAEGACDGGA